MLALTELGLKSLLLFFEPLDLLIDSPCCKNGANDKDHEEQDNETVKKEVLDVLCHCFNQFIDVLRIYNTDCYFLRNFSFK